MLVFSFQDLALYFGLKPKTGEKEVTPDYLFMVWFEFCSDFKARWKRENKSISKDRYQTALCTYISRTTTAVQQTLQFRKKKKMWLTQA